MNVKQFVGEKAVDYIKDEMIVGLGTGTTAYWAIKKIAERVSNGLKIKSVPTSKETEKLALDLKIPLIDISKINKIDLTIDGADEVDNNKNLIKGGGGALLREKIIASITDFYIIIIDDSKKVNILGRYPLPVEVTPFAFEITKNQLKSLGCSTKIRVNGGKPYITDNGNYIIDCQFEKIQKPEITTREINSIPGVVENGLFVNMTDIILIGYDENKIHTIQ